MELIKTYEGSKQLKVWEYDHTDSRNFTNNFNCIDIKIADRLCDYLKEKNIKVKVSECYDGQSGWRGANFYIENEDLSGNGYCLSSSSINNFLDNR